MVRALQRAKKERLISELSPIPLNQQKFKAITIDERITFVDSLAFLSDSLANLVNMLQKDKSKFPILRQMPGMDEEKISLMTKKGVYPYGFASSIAKLEQTTQLPSIKHFKNDLSGEECSLADWQRANDVWDRWDCENMMDYTKVYLDSDVYLLADIVVQFRNKMWDTFNLDLAQYLSLPHLAMDIMLKVTGVEIGLITDEEMSDLVTDNIRGGLSYVNLRLAETVRKKKQSDECSTASESQSEVVNDELPANDVDVDDEQSDQGSMHFNGQDSAYSDSNTSSSDDSEMGSWSEADWSSTDEEREKESDSDESMEAMKLGDISSDLDQAEKEQLQVKEEGEGSGHHFQEQSLLYLDANNLYGHAMTFPMPVGKFEWVSAKKLHKFNTSEDYLLSSISEKDPKGYFFEVDLEYPEELHAAHASFPLAPHNMTVREKHLSSYAKECLEEMDKPQKYKAKKLTSTFLRRKRYLVHGLNLKFYLKKGMQLLKIRRAIQFDQKDFLRPFIYRCTEMRRRAKTVCEATMW